MSRALWSHYARDTCKSLRWCEAVGREILKAVDPEQTCAFPTSLLRPPLSTQRAAPGHSGAVCLGGGGGDTMGRNSLPFLPRLRWWGFTINSCSAKSLAAWRALSVTPEQQTRGPSAALLAHHPRQTSLIKQGTLALSEDPTSGSFSTQPSRLPSPVRAGKWFETKLSAPR